MKLGHESLVGCAHIVLDNSVHNARLNFDPQVLIDGWNSWVVLQTHSQLQLPQANVQVRIRVNQDALHKRAFVDRRGELAEIRRRPIAFLNHGNREDPNAAHKINTSCWVLQTNGVIVFLKVIRDSRANTKSGCQIYSIQDRGSY